MNRAALILAAAIVLASFLAFGVYDTVGLQGANVGVVNRFTGAVRICDYDECNWPTKKN